MPTKAKDTTQPAAAKPTASKPLPRIGRKKAAEPAQVVEEEEVASKAVKAPPKKTVSLIDDSADDVDMPEIKSKAKVAPKISRIKAKGDKEPEPAIPEPAAPEPAAPEPEDAPVSSDSEEEDLEPGVVHIKPPIIVKELAVKMNLKPFQLIADLMELEIFAALNHTIDADIAAKLCEKHGLIFEKEARKKGEGVHAPEPVVEPPPEPVLPVGEEAEHRAPIVTFMGHVDHGKTSLLDAIRKTRVAAREAGGITQHIGAYSVEREGKLITFLDTPGHEAFTQMRARGANVTDIAVIVVAADDGLMPQTLEALSHAKAANVKIMIAINKIDLPGANPDRVKQQLQEKGFTTEDWGGDVAAVEVSAIKGTGMDDMLELILLEAELMELRAMSDTDARGVVIEAQLESGRGPTATVIVQTGTLRVGDSFLCGNFWGRVKSLINDQGKPIKDAGPAMPVKILGFTGLPNAGDEFVVMPSEKDARILSEERIADDRRNTLARPQRATLESLMHNFGKEQAKKLQVILKTDVQGSLEAIIASIDQIETKKVDVEIIHAAAGPITESDVLLASASNAIIIGFNTKVEGGAVKAAKREDVQVKLYSIIYELLDQMKEAMAGLLDPETRENIIGHAEIKQLFEVSKGVVAGCVVIDGRIARTARARVLRGKQPVYDGGLATLRRFQDDVKEVRAGVECGIKLGDFNGYQIRDIIECYTLEKVAQVL